MIGHRIQGYTVESLLGQGAMGRVYLVSKGGVRYALKMMQALGTDPRFLQRFEREARAAAAVDRHPNIVSIHCYGVYQNHPYMIFDFIEGQDLQSLLETNHILSPEDCARIGVQIARALHHAHQRQIIHRDIKPANILLRGEDQQALLSDFGLARKLDSEALTRTGEIVGTPQTMAPEQLSGQAANASSDVWALGVTLYKAATGSWPFLGNTIADIAHNVMHSQPVPPRQLLSRIPERFETILLACLERNPRHRYQSCFDLAEAFQAFLDGKDTQAPSRPAKKRSFGTLIMAVVLVAGLGLVGFAWQRQQQAQRHRQKLKSHLKKLLESSQWTEAFKHQLPERLCEKILSLQSSTAPSSVATDAEDFTKHLELWDKAQRDPQWSQACRQLLPARRLKELQDWAQFQSFYQGPAKDTSLPQAEPLRTACRVLQTVRQRDREISLSLLSDASQISPSFASFLEGYRHWQRQDWSQAQRLFESCQGFFPKLKTKLSQLADQALIKACLKPLLSPKQRLRNTEAFDKMAKKLRRTGHQDPKQYLHKAPFKDAWTRPIKEHFKALKSLPERAKFAHFLNTQRLKWPFIPECPSDEPLLIELIRQAENDDNWIDAFVYSWQLRKQHPGTKFRDWVTRNDLHSRVYRYETKQQLSKLVDFMWQATSNDVMLYVRAETLRNLAQGGHFERCCKTRPVMHGWWAMAPPESEQGSETFQREVKDRLWHFDKALELKLLGPAYTSVMLYERSRLRREANPPGLDRPQDRRNLERALRLNAWFPDRILFEIALTYPPKTEAFLKFLRESELELKRRLQLCIDGRARLVNGINGVYPCDQSQYQRRLFSVRVNQAHGLYLQNDFQGALKAAQQADSLRNDRGTRSMVLRCLYKLGKHEQCLKYFQKYPELLKERDLKALYKTLSAAQKKSKSGS